MEEQPVPRVQSIPCSWKLYACPYLCYNNFPWIDRSPKYRRRKRQDPIASGIKSRRFHRASQFQGYTILEIREISDRIRVVERCESRRGSEIPFLPGWRELLLPPPLFLVNRNRSEPVTCGNRDNYNVSARFRRDAGRIPVITKPPPPLWNRPPGGESTLMLAPVTGNHPRSVFQSVSLLFNYPFKPYNLVGTGHDAACGERHTGKIGARDMENGGAERRRETWDPSNERRSTGFASASVHRYRYTEIRMADNFVAKQAAFLGRPPRDTSSFSQA